MSELLDFTALIGDKEPEEDDGLPEYTSPGSILVEVALVYPCRSLMPWTWYPYEIEESSYDASASSFWINEGTGVDYWFKDAIDVEQPGWYVVEGITGSVSIDPYTREGNEDWEFESVRYATLEEVRAHMGEGYVPPEQYTQFWRPA